MKTTKTAKMFVLTFSILLILLITQPTLKIAQAQESSEKTYKALFLVSNAHGDNYYDLVGNFSQWGWNLETAGQTNVVMGCSNHHPAYTLNFNLTFNDLNRSKIREYYCLIIPSGGHWYSLANSESVKTIIKTAHNNGLILGTLCIGQAVLVNVDGLMNGVKVGHFYMTSVDMQQANAEIIYEDVVTDKRIVTGGGGGGLNGGGYTVAPTAEFCEAVKNAIQIRDQNNILYSIFGPIGGFC